MSVGSPTAGTWSSSQWRADNEFETDRIYILDNGRCQLSGDRSTHARILGDRRLDTREPKYCPKAIDMLKSNDYACFHMSNQLPKEA